MPQATQQPATAALVSIDWGRGLVALASQLADLEDLYGITLQAKSVSQRQVSLGPSGQYTAEQIEASRAAGVFHDIERRTHDLTDTLQDLILQGEPRTLDETLSLVLVYKNLMALYLSDLSEFPETINKQETHNREFKLDRAVDAIIRGLVHGAGASSPLTAKYADAEESLTPWDERRHKATKLAKGYPLKTEAHTNGEVSP